MTPDTQPEETPLSVRGLPVSVCRGIHGPGGPDRHRAVGLLRRHYGWSCPVLANVRPPQAGTYANPGLWRGQAASCADHRGGNCLSGLWTSLGGEAHQAIKKPSGRAALWNNPTIFMPDACARQFPPIRSSHRRTTATRKARVSQLHQRLAGGLELETLMSS